MTSFARLAVCMAAALVCVVPVTTVADAPSSHANANACFAMAKGAYGFSCIGSAFTGATLEPISFGGVVEGSATGFYEGYGTFNSSNGSAHTHFSGQVNYGKNCEGHADCEAVRDDDARRHARTADEEDERHRGEQESQRRERERGHFLQADLDRHE